jgi:hypothetical protein
MVWPALLFNWLFMLWALVISVLVMVTNTNSNFSIGLLIYEIKGNNNNNPSLKRYTSFSIALDVTFSLIFIE